MVFFCFFFWWLSSLQQCSYTRSQPLSWVILSVSQVFPVNLLSVLKAEYTKLSFPKAICDPSDLLDSRHGNALALYGTVRYYIISTDADTDHEMIRIEYLLWVFYEGLRIESEIFQHWPRLFFTLYVLSHGLHSHFKVHNVTWMWF